MEFRDQLINAIKYLRLERLKSDLLKHQQYEWASLIRSQQKEISERDEKVISNSKIISQNGFIQIL